MTTAFVMIGNSDDKLTQARWAEFFSQTSLILREHGHVHGQWASEPASAWQNACWCVEFAESGTAATARRELAVLAGQYDQDSIAWAEAPVTEFIGPPS